ncbi:hypothetical protein K469DRAFT_42810 [Zopfia rhizophila CBS 207.26]|uniref:Secreted protein n=1 Tax=Zopfia rhizophila CBS 207.26 TaxID=1314779 RepID=A0A6A6EG01_9PEZI|nr:hypothetical protein K469DRAFT_42810 [Zopfia rhizophila CBS 207.26]
MVATITVHLRHHHCLISILLLLLSPTAVTIYARSCYCPILLFTVNLHLLHAITRDLREACIFTIQGWTVNSLYFLPLFVK